MVRREGDRFHLAGPASEVMSIWIEPRVACSVDRTQSGNVHAVEISMHETALHAEHRGASRNAALLDILSRSTTFTPRSYLRFVQQNDDTYLLTASIELCVALDLPGVPRATVRIANAAGSAVLRSVCARTSKQRLREIEEAYYEWEAATQS